MCSYVGIKTIVRRFFSGRNGQKNIVGIRYFDLVLFWCVQKAAVPGFNVLNV